MNLKNFVTTILFLSFFLVLGFVQPVEASRDNAEAEEHFFQASNYLFQAQEMRVKLDPSRSTYYALAMQEISKAVTLDQDAADYFLLASLVYRGKGAKARGQERFDRAELLYRNALEENPDSIGANLDLAIALFAGNSSKTDEMESLRHKVFDMIKIKKSSNETQLVEALAVAYILNGKLRLCRVCLENHSKNNEAIAQFKDELDKYLEVDTSGKLFLFYYITLKDRYSEL